MPIPSKGEAKSEYLTRCIREVIGEGATQEQAVGKCEGMWQSSVNAVEADIITLGQHIRASEFKAIQQRAYRDSAHARKQWFSPLITFLQELLQSDTNVANVIESRINTLGRHVRLDSEALANSLESAMTASLVDGAKEAFKKLPKQSVHAMEFKPVADAVAQLSRKTPVGSALNSEQWSAVPSALKNRAFFSARVESGRLLSRMQDGLGKIFDHTRDAQTALFNRGRFMDEMVALAEREGLPKISANKIGTIEDITSEKRLNLIYDVQMGHANSFANWKASQDPDLLDAYPAQELIRVEDRAEPRDWPERWSAAGGQFFGDRMVALLDDPVWDNLGDGAGGYDDALGSPFPPFAYNSGYGVEAVSRGEAEDMGLIAPNEEIQSQDRDFNENLEASLEDVNDEQRRELAVTFGDKIKIEGDKAVWQP